MNTPMNTAPQGTAGGHPGTATPGGSVPSGSGLPALPELSHVSALVRGHSARVTFDPYPGAVDYRVYVMPQASDVMTNADGSFAGVNNGTYRCAGYRVSADAEVDGDQGPSANPVPGSLGIATKVGGTSCSAPDQCDTQFSEQVANYTRPADEATLGYAFEDPVAGAIPVYAVGDPGPYADIYGGGVRPQQTRSKLYVTDNTSYLKSGWRDDGIAFYVPDSATSAACGAGGAPVQVVTQDYQDFGGPDHLFYMAGGKEASAHAGNTFHLMPVPPTPAFFLCPQSVSGSLPVMRTYYAITSRTGHDELSLGPDRYMRARCQASTFGACANAPHSLWEVHWSDITAPTELIVEALDAGCPFQGLIGSGSVPAATTTDGTLSSPQLFTTDEVRATAPHGEVFLNGQFDGSPTPHPIARSAVMVQPEPDAAMDFASNFTTPAETFTPIRDEAGNTDCGLQEVFASVHETPTLCCCQNVLHWQSPTYDALELSGETPSFGVVQGEMSVFNLNGWFHMSPRGVTATVSDSGYLYVVLDVSSYTTTRRYPHIVVSQQDFMTSQWLLNASAETLSTAQQADPWIQPVLILQPFAAQPNVLEIELCNQRAWQVNNQCPSIRLENVDPTPGQSAAYARGANYTPHPPPLEHEQADDSARYELYLSSTKAYVFFEGQPYGCADLANRTSTDPGGTPIMPTPASPSGTVSVAFGDVLYHPAAEDNVYAIDSAFHIEHSILGDLRHFDYFAFKSNVDAPVWDESRFPCAKQMHEGGGVVPESD